MAQLYATYKNQYNCYLAKSLAWISSNRSKIRTSEDSRLLKWNVWVRKLWENAISTQLHENYIHRYIHIHFSSGKAIRPRTNRGSGSQSNVTGVFVVVVVYCFTMWTFQLRWGKEPSCSAEETPCVLESREIKHRVRRRNIFTRNIFISNRIIFWTSTSATRSGECTLSHTVCLPFPFAVFLLGVWERFKKTFSALRTSHTSCFGFHLRRITCSSKPNCAKFPSNWAGWVWQRPNRYRYDRPARNVSKIKREKERKDIEQNKWAANTLGERHKKKRRRDKERVGS